MKVANHNISYLKLEIGSSDHCFEHAFDLTANSLRDALSNGYIKGKKVEFIKPQFKLFDF